MKLLIALLFLTITVSLDFTVAQIGVAYGRNGNNLPSPMRVVELYKQYNIRRMRIYDPHPETLRALRGSGIGLSVGIPNSHLASLASDRAAAAAWVRNNVQPYYPGVNFRHIIVGNEIMPGNTETGRYTNLLLPAMRNIHAAISTVAGLAQAVKVTTAVGTEVVDPTSNFPPENGRFRAEVASFIDPIIRFLSETRAPLFANVYPYFAYEADQRGARNIDIRYARLDPDFPGITTLYGHTYKNLYYALIDAVNAAVEKSFRRTAVAEPTVGGRTEPPEVHGAETGNPTIPGRSGFVGDVAQGGDMGTTENARRYINNLIQVVKSGTPLRPGRPIETYIFAMFDENEKPGADAERHFGLFFPDGRPKYPINFN